jgi:hypothetical protein
MEPLAYCRGQSRVVAIAHENVCRRMLEEVLQRPSSRMGGSFKCSASKTSRVRG